jgi:gamma-glutamyltranspeptidase/glutathione hydrolase
VPGTVRGLELAHRKFGKLAWAEVVGPAADLATSGWKLSAALAKSLNDAVRGKLGRFQASASAYGKPGGGEWAEGDRIQLPDLGKVLRDIATAGPDVFYSGWIADSIDAQMRANGGIITKDDLEEYRAIDSWGTRSSRWVLRRREVR